MAIKLSKNSSISLTKEVKQLSKVTVGLGWDMAKPTGFLSSLFGATSIDLDASCVLLDEKLREVDTVWFGQLKSKCGAIKHSGDNRTGDGDGDDEQIIISLPKLPKSVHHLAITVNSYAGQSFEKVDNAFCRVMDRSSKEICRFTLSEQGRHTGVFIGLLSVKQGEWIFSSKGIPMSGRTVDELKTQVMAHI
ncbi:TerD family protein [Vibrio ostreicida]|uniref:TerD family protein n=1 Tax=Vibrio ostreicida TaxID=526588 RepID=UPI003B59FECD